MQNTRVLFIPSAVGISHLTRLLLIANELRNRSLNIGFAYGGSHSELLSRLDYKVFHFEDVESTDFNANIFSRFTETNVDECIRAQVKILSAFSPDVVVTDFHPTASVSARLASLPCISVLNGYLTEYFDVTGLFVDAEDHPFRYRLTDFFARKILAVQKRALATPFRRVSQKHGMRGKSNLYDFLEGDLNLIADLPEFCCLKEPPDNYHFIGPLIWEGTDGDFFKIISRPSARQKVIYVTTGNTGSPDLLERILDTFSGLDPYQIIITTGLYIDPVNYQGHPNIHVSRFIPGSEVMRGCDLVIHCGGNGTTYQCLANGLPSIVVPFNNDQRINARLVQHHAVGIALLPEKLGGSRLLAGVKHLLEKSTYRLRVRHFHQILRHVDGPKSAANAILAYLEKGKLTPNGNRSSTHLFAFKRI